MVRVRVARGANRSLRRSSQRGAASAGTTTARAPPTGWPAPHKAAAVVSAALAAGLLCGTPALASAAYAPPPTSASTRASSSSSASTRLDTNLATPPLPDDAGESVILDYGKVLGPSATRQLTGDLRDLEDATGWKLRLLTSYGAASAPPVRAAQQYWRADPKTIVVTVDESLGNVVDFFSDLSVKSTIPKNVFQELRGRYGNVYYLRESGAEAAAVQVLGVLRGCLAQGGCQFVPGLSDQQRQFSLIAVTSGAFLSGAVLRNGLSRWTYLFLFIWVPWIFLFGFFPLVQRQPDDLRPLIENAGIFATIFALTWLTPLLGEVSLPFTEAKEPDDATVRSSGGAANDEPPPSEPSRDNDE